MQCIGSIVHIQDVLSALHHEAAQCDPVGHAAHRGPQVIIAQDYVFHPPIPPSAAHGPDDGAQGQDLHAHQGGLEDPQVDAAQPGHLPPLLMAHLSHPGPHNNNDIEL
ncbi:hypothetical protein EYF80_038935 [Liparis tanakae]|uniref:Uncharacterized protein n=1 Tax=Liparis tanakae TaxID=230148 RepID=A0A4Z2GDV3_9TELE|nr:hypothetical protein EYF80_038935 [Liparis tanakae]